MNSAVGDRPDPALVRQLTEVLQLRERESPEPARAGLIDELIAAADCGIDVPLPDIVEAVERSSLGTPKARKQRRSTPPAVIAEVLGRAARITARDKQDDDGSVAEAIRRGDAVPVEGPIPDWLREVHRMRERRGLDQEKVLVELEGMGFSLTADQLTETLMAVPVCHDRELVRSIVTVLGGDWTGRGYEASYDAALDEHRRLDGRPGGLVGRQDVSGLEGADPLTPRTLLRQVRAEYELLPPVVRGRDELIAGLVGLLDAPSARTHVLVGGGGAGKCTVAMAVAAAARDRGHRVWWVNAADRNQVTRGMLAVATQLNAPVAELNAIQSNPEEGAELLWRRMDASSTRWLLVFADADDPEVFTIRGDGERRSWLRPSSAGTVMVTSRVRAAARWSEQALITRVGDLPAEAGALVLLDQIRTDGAAADPEQLAQARRISERLGGVALALRTVGRYVASSIGSQDLAHVLVALGEERPADVRTCARFKEIWELAMTALAQRGAPEARTLMRMLACYAPNWVVPLDALTPERLAASGLPVSEPGTDPISAWQRALDGLLEVGLISHKVTSGAGVTGVVVQRLVAEVSRAVGTPDSDAVEAAAVQVLLAGRNEFDSGRPANWPALRRLEPHVYSLLDNLRTVRPDVRGAALLLAVRIAQGLIRAGLFALGEALIRHAQARTRDLDPQAPESLDAEHTLAWALGLRGELADAESRFRALLLERRRIWGPEHPCTLSIRDLLAWVLAEQGRLDEAHNRFRDLLPVCERVLGPDDRRTLAVRHRLAWITALRGRPDQAEIQFAGVLPQRIRVLGADHMEVLSTRYRLAWSRSLQGQHEVAEADFVELLGDLERVFEPESAPVIMVRSRLAVARMWLGRFTDAEIDARFVVEARERVLGAHHPRTLRARTDLAKFLQHKGDFRSADRIYREVLAEVERTRQLGKDHPLSLDIRHRLCRLLIDSGRLEEAERSARALVVRRQRVSGWEHPSTVASRYFVALALMRRGRYAEAQDRLEAVLADQQRLLGDEHRYTLETRAMLAELAGRRGWLPESYTAVVEVLKSRQAALGPDHADTVDSRERLVWILGEMDLLAEAEERCRDLVADCTRALGPMHPDTLSARYRLAWVLGLAERGVEAEQAYRGLVADQQRLLGREHPHTLRSRHGLARELVRAGRPAEAEQELRSILIDRIHILGRQHPDTLINRHELAFTLAEQGYYDDAQRSMQAVLLEQLDALGADHRSTLLTRERLAWIQERQGRLEDAADHWRQLLRDRERLFGPDHPDTVRVRERLARSSHEVPRLW